MSDDLDAFRRALEESHGHRVALASQHIRNGDGKQALKAEAEALAFRRVLHALEDVEAGTFDHVATEKYIELSRAKRRADEPEDGQDEHLRGMQ